MVTTKITQTNYQIQIDDNGDMVIPETQGEKQDFLQTLWGRIFGEGNEFDLVPIYNRAAEAYNKTAGQVIMLIINNNVKQKTMAEKKAAAKKAVPKKAAIKKGAVKKVAEKKPAAKKVAPKKAAPKKAEGVPAEGKKETQKEIIVRLHGEGKTINEIVEISGIQKPNVSYYFSKLKLNKKDGN